jgi:hypothetical protein
MARFIVIIFLLCAVLQEACAQRTAPFISVSGNRGFPTITNPLPYEKPQTLFEYIDSTCTFLNQKKTGWTYTVYFEIKDSLQELGIRIISPLPDLLSPAKGDIMTNAFQEKPEKDNTGFKPEIYLLKAVAKSEDMNFIEMQDMTPLKMKDRLHPTIRLVSKDEKNLLAPGIYKLVIFTQDRSKPSGAFALQFGSIPRMPMPALYSSPNFLK